MVGQALNPILPGLFFVFLSRLKVIICLSQREHNVSPLPPPQAE